jgi:hypothetical protein
VATREGGEEMTEEDSKYLADWIGVKYYMGLRGYIDLGNGLLVTPDSWELFGVVFTKARKQEWWDEFLDPYFHRIECMYSTIPITLIGPHFAQQVVAFLKGREK